MKTSLAQNHEPTTAVMFPIAARPEEICPPPVRRTRFTNLMPHPEGQEGAFQNGKRENDGFEASRIFDCDRNGAGTNALSQNHGAPNDSSRLRAGLKTVEFYLHAPFAGRVKLAAEFTNWEESPLDLVKFEGGVWSIFVPLRPGSYEYHFIVDGERCEDPRPVLPDAEPGAAHAVVKVPASFWTWISLDRNNQINGNYENNAIRSGLGDVGRMVCPCR